MCWAASQAGDSEMNQTKKPILKKKNTHTHTQNLSLGSSRYTKAHTNKNTTETTYIYAIMLNSKR